MIYGSRAYAEVGLQSSVMSATPHKLIGLLFEGAISSLIQADIHLQHKAIAEKGKAISKAINIISNGLSASLDMEKGGEISQNLAALYDYMIRRLTHANRHNDTQVLQEIIELLRGLFDTWQQISPNGTVNYAQI